MQNVLIFTCFEQHIPIFEVPPRTAGSAEYIDFYILNAFLSLRSLRGLPGVQHVLIFACFEQCFPILEVTPRTAGSADCIDFYML